MVKPILDEDTLNQNKRTTETQSTQREKLKIKFGSIIQGHEIMVLSKKDQEVFIEALLNPPAPNQKLRAAAERYKKNMGIYNCKQND